MNNPKFYIYGVPDGFNMLSGTPDEILYYQLFYNTSKKGREMRINRKANGETIYSYLIYNLVSCKGREGAFLGMSVSFSGNEYCNEPTVLKELFEGIYNEVILKADDKDKIVVPIDGGNAVGRFCISKFDERKEMCEKIGRIIVNNIIGELEGKIATIDSSFDNNKEGRILTLPISADNKSIIQGLRNYTWVSLSTEYKVAPVSPQSQKTGQRMIPVTPNEDLLSIHFIEELKKKVSSYKDFIIDGLTGQVASAEIAKKKDEINHYLDTLEEYVGRQPELKTLKDDYMSIYNKIITLNSQKQKPADNRQPRPLPPPPNPPYNNKEKDLVKLLLPHLSKIIMGVLGLIFILILVVVLWPSNESPSDNNTDKGENEVAVDEPIQSFDRNAFDRLLNNADYEAAWKMIQEVEGNVEQQNLNNKLQNSYRDWFRQEFDKSYDNLPKLQDLKKKITTYIAFNADNDRNNEELDERINQLQEEERLLAQNRAHGQINANGGGNAPAPKPDVIRIYKADVNYNRGSLVSAENGYIIRCKRGDQFVVEGAEFKSADNGIEVAPQGDGTIRIRAKNTSSYKIKLNQIEYTFNVSNK